MEWDSERVEIQATEVEKTIEPETKMLNKLFIETSQDNDGGWSGEAARSPLSLE